ncbi:unnamed protein product [Ilex paraguariensis]|uniref:Uncharacterized protein n=1 Tax=Ilex paraguariensis TaxID=185542 RepID=A0ABC8SAQ7_9AQUA
MEEQKQLELHESHDDLSVCPSFNSYSSGRLADIAVRVSEELRHESELGDNEAQRIDSSNDRNGEQDDDFEFALVRGDTDALADEIFYDGQIRPVFPIFNRDLLENDADDREIKASDDVSSIRIPLRNLFVREREEGEHEPEPPSSSSSEVDELESVPEGTYCVWRPKVVESSPSECKKSNSTGSASKRWKIRDLLRRSNSDGKDSFVFLTPKAREEKHPKEKKNTGEFVKVSGEPKSSSSSSSSSAHESLSKSPANRSRRRRRLLMRFSMYGTER